MLVNSQPYLANRPRPMANQPPAAPAAMPPDSSRSPVVAGGAGSEFATDFKAIGAERLVEYKNLGKDIVQLLTTNPAKTLKNIWTNVFQNGQGQFTFGNGIAGVVNFIAGTVGSFLDLRVKPYVTAIKEGNLAMVGARLSVDFIDFVTFAALFKGVSSLLKLGATPAVSAASVASTAAKSGLVKQLSADALKGGAVWMGVNTTLRQVTAVSKPTNGMPGGGEDNASPLSRAQRVEDNKWVLLQNGINVQATALNVLKDPNVFSDQQVETFKSRALKINLAGIPYGNINENPYNPGNPAVFAGKMVQTDTREVKYLAWMPEDRYQALKAVCDQADGYNFYKLMLAKAPDINGIPRLVDEMRTYALAMQSLTSGNYRFVGKDSSGNQVQDPALDDMLTMKRSPKEILLANVKAAYGGSLSDADAAALVNQLWQSNPVGSRSINFVG